MRHAWLHAVALTLSLCACAAAQEGRLVRQDESKDPCRLYKMRVLVPAEPGGRGARREGTAEGIDRKMVRNPCRADEIQLAKAPAADGGEPFPIPRTTLEPMPGFGGRRQPSEARRLLPASGFELMRVPK